MKKVCLALCLAASCSLSALGQQFRASYSPAVSNQPFTGRVIAYLSKENKEPRTEEVWLKRFPCFMVAVNHVKPGESIVLDDKAVAYPVALSNIERGEYYVQIVWDRNLGGRAIGASAGNLYNPAQKISLTKDYKAIFRVVATKTVPAEAEFKETEFAKELKVPSPLLSAFLSRPTTVDAAVILPKEYQAEPDRKFPVVFEIAGYQGVYRRFSGSTTPSPTLAGTPVIKVFLDGKCPLGHSVYANSDNNGPWSDALLTELIPALEKRFRCNGARFLWGHSSGGWTALWLQTHYPKDFTACWASSPDPVDFRSFFKVDLYQNQNLFYAPDSSLRSMATVAQTFPWLAMKDIYRAEDVMYRGEQMHSFDAVFSKKGRDGWPQALCNSRTGAVDSTVVNQWKAYDISLYLHNNWAALKPDLDGKVRVSVGTFDNFYLNHAVVLLEKRMKELNASFQFVYYPADHFTLGTHEYVDEGYAFLNQKYTEWQAKQPTTGKNKPGS